MVQVFTTLLYWCLCVALALSHNGSNSCNERDSRSDRAGSNVAFKEDDGDYERISMTLESESTQANPNAKAVHCLMTATCNGVFGQTKYMTI